MGWTCTQHKSMRTGSNSKRLCSFIHGKGPAGSWTSFLCWVECQSGFRFSLAPIGNERERWMDSFLFHGCDCKACHAKLLTFQCPTLVSKSWDGSSKDGLVIAKKKRSSGSEFSDGTGQRQEKRLSCPGSTATGAQQLEQVCMCRTVRVAPRPTGRDTYHRIGFC
jgi:hypothetical protein